MATRSKFVKVFITDAKGRSLAGYHVIGDFIDDGQRRVLLLERPETVAAPRKPRTKKALAPTPVTPLIGVANG